jgi:hypothetical protein
MVGQLDSTCTYSPTAAGHHQEVEGARRRVAVQVAFRKQRLETRITLYRLQGLQPPGAFKLWVNFIQLVQPHRRHPALEPQDFLQQLELAVHRQLAGDAAD